MEEFDQNYAGLISDVELDGILMDYEIVPIYEEETT